jgi:hypothetical protein
MIPVRCMTLVLLVTRLPRSLPLLMRSSCVMSSTGYARDAFLSCQLGIATWAVISSITRTIRHVWTVATRQQRGYQMAKGFSSVMLSMILKKSVSTAEQPSHFPDRLAIRVSTTQLRWPP